MAWATKKKPAERINHLEREKSGGEPQAIYRAPENNEEEFEEAVNR
jgi:hypothetical protein